MGLRDRFRSRQSAEDDEPAGPSAAAPPDPIDFRPRFDGAYVRDQDGGISLRFGPATVQETDDGAAADGPATGEYTSSGRFVVQRRFGRPIVYTVLAVTGEGFTARRTDTDPAGGVTEPTFSFRPN